MVIVSPQHSQSLPNIRRVRTFSAPLQQLPANHLPSPHPSPSPEGSMDRGGPTPTFAAPRQQQCGDQHVATPPPTTRADGQPGGPPSVHPQAQARGGGCGMTAKQQQQQQQAPARSPTEQARLAISLYRQCVAAGQWVKISLEQRPDGNISPFTVGPRQQRPLQLGFRRRWSPAGGEGDQTRSAG